MSLGNLLHVSVISVQNFVEMALFYDFMFVTVDDCER